MIGHTLKKPAGIFALLLVSLFFLWQGPAFSDQPADPTSQRQMNNRVTPPMQQAPLKPMNNNQISNSDGSSSSCALTLSTGPKGDIRDIRGPIHIPDPTRWLLYALGGAFLLFLAWVAWKYFGRRKAFRARKAYEIAFEELERAKAYMVPENAERFSVMVSGTVRTYVEKRFNMQVTRKTTREFISLVAEKPSSELTRHSESLQAFLSHCDLAKFARRTLSTQEMKDMLESAWQFVLETKPQPEEEKAFPKKTVLQNTADLKTAPKGIRGKTSFFKSKFFGRASRNFTKKALNQGLRRPHHVVTAGGN